MRPRFSWNIGARCLDLGERTLIMGVVNVTPDSFSDGGLYFEPKRAVEHALKLLDEGADVVDIGGESTRPGAAVAAEGETMGNPAKVPVSEDEEMRRVLPVVSELNHARPNAIVSIDTYKANVARAAVEAGAEIVNDISGFSWDPKMASTVAELKCGAVLMHMRGRPETWRKLPAPPDVVGLVRDELKQRTAVAIAAGVDRSRMVIDPGLGFGKNFEQNYPLLARLHELQELGFPLMVAASRKSFIGRALRGDGIDLPPEERLFGTLAAETIAMNQGAHIIRTHDVKAAVDAARVVDALLNAAAD